MRLKANQGRHDAEVLRRGVDAKKKGWATVFVDLPNYIKPPTINGYIPDIYAHNGAEELLIEIETNDTNSLHAVSQHVAFRQWANQRPLNRKFVVFVV